LVNGTQANITTTGNNTTTTVVNMTTTSTNSTAMYSGLGVVGHSLGGGLAIITGAQKGVPAVALSGPNAMLSRKSFDPPISREALDKKTFVSTKIVYYYVLNGT
jgi:putative lipase involved disintegration of autophagic bodies